MATLEFLGATETGAGRLLVDCGLYQGLKTLRLATGSVCRWTRREE